MKRILLLLTLAFVTMGGCYKHNFDHELFIKAPEQDTVFCQVDECHTVGESLEESRIEFSLKLQEVRRALMRKKHTQQRVDSLTLETARPFPGGQ